MGQASVVPGMTAVYPNPCTDLVSQRIQISDGVHHPRRTRVRAVCTQSEFDSSYSLSDRCPNSSKSLEHSNIFMGYPRAVLTGKKQQRLPDSARWWENRRRLEDHRRRLKSNRRRLEGKQRRLEGKRRRLKGNRRRLKGN